MRRLVVSYATGRYVKGLERLDEAVLLKHGAGGLIMPWGIGPWPNTKSPGADAWPIPKEWPTHQDIPYGFKAYALKAAVDAGAEILLWADAAILPIRSMEPLWERIEREGAWIHNGGWINSQWTADSAYPDLFRSAWDGGPDLSLEQKREINRTIPHVVATTFGINVKHPLGRAILNEYFRLASETQAFCGPWWNSNGEREDYRKNAGAAPCGPPSTLGHRHDQTCLSVIAWRHGVKLTEGQEIFDYSKRRPDGTLHLSDHDERTILLADGAMHDGVVYA